MLEIFNRLRPFFEDNYRKISVREYARAVSVSPPTAATLLRDFHKQGLLLVEKERNYIFYSTNRNSFLFVALSRTYWQQVFDTLGLVDYLKKELINPVVVLFGSFSKAEIHKESDIDMAIFSVSRKKIDLRAFEKSLKRKIQVFSFISREKVDNKYLLNNIFNGFILGGSW